MAFIEAGLFPLIDIGVRIFLRWTFAPAGRLAKETALRSDF